jgi:DNA primase
VKYSEEILDEIRNRVDIVGIISEYVPLKPSGKGHKGLCPFHQEKTPSFMVDSEKQIFHCFGCGEGGNVFSFIMKMEKLNFPEAVKMLAEKAGVQLPTPKNQDSQLYRERETILRLNEISASYYQKILYEQNGKKALKYLSERNFKKETIQKFHLGYALPGYEHLIKILVQKKFKATDLFKAGLAVKSRKTGNVIDYFRNRVMFPIINLQGKIIAFGGRVLDDALPKYINSPETPVYSKGKNLYGLFQARMGIRQKNQVIIMEGYTDVLMAHQYGFDNTVGSLGTALTTQQIDLLKRYADEVIIAFDSDTAGKNATLRSLNLIKKAGIKIRIISLPADSDPADVLLKKGADFFDRLIEKSLPLIDYKLEILTQQHNPASSEGKIAIARGLFDDLANIDSQLELHAEVKKIAERLGLEEDTMFKDLSRYQRGNRTLPSISTSAKNVTESTHINAEKILIGSMVQDSGNIEKILSELDINDFTNKEHREIVSVIKGLFENGEKVNIQKIIDQLENQNIIKLLSEIVFKDVVHSDEETIIRSINAIKKYQLQLKLNTIRIKIKQEESENNEVKPELLQDYQNILHKIKTLV